MENFIKNIIKAVDFSKDTTNLNLKAKIDNAMGESLSAIDIDFRSNFNDKSRN